MGVLERLSDEEIQLLCDSFVRVDSEHDGFRAPDQLPSFLAMHFPVVDGATLDRLRNILAETRGPDGLVDVREFIMTVRDGNVGALRSLLDPAGLNEDDPEYADVRSIISRLQPDEMDMYRDAFIKLDADGDGYLSRDEVMDGCGAVLRERFPPMRTYLDKIFDVADKDKDNMLCLREFMGSFADGPGAVPHEVVLDCTALVRLRLTDDEIAQLQMCFRDMDTNSDGFLDRAELKAGLKRELEAQYPRHTDAQFDELVSVVLAAADRDRDGKLNISEFIRSFQEEQGVLPSSFMQVAEGGAADADAQDASGSAANNNSSTGTSKQGVRLTKEQHQYLAQAFANMDTNQDGFLDADELHGAVTNCVVAMMPERADEAQAIARVVDVILRVGDTNHDGRMSWREFVHAFTHNTDIVDILEEVAEVGHSGFQSQLAPEEVANLKSAFAALDRNGDGFVSRKELAASVKLLVENSRMRREVVQEIVNAVMAEADEDGDGKLTLSEFVRAFAAGNNEIMDLGSAAAVASDIAKRSKNSLRKEQVAALKDAFATLDRNSDGFVDAQELRSALVKMLEAEYSDEKEVRDIVDIILSAADSNRDGKLSLTEFIRAFVQHADVMVLSVAAADHILSTRERILQTLTPDEIEALREAFRELDANHDGYIDEKEFKRAITQIVERSVKRSGAVPEVVHIIMDAADADKDHRVSFEEFLTAFAQEPEVMSAAWAAAAAKQAARKAKRALTRDQVAAIKDAFATLDKDHDGFLDRAELYHAIFSIIEPHAAGRAQFASDLTDLIIRSADKNADGKLNLTEFVRAFTQHAEIMQVAGEAAEEVAARDQEELVARLRNRLMEDEINQLRSMFSQLDLNNDGELDHEELAAGVRSVLSSGFAIGGEDGTVEEIVRTILAICDRDNNGRLSLQEFLGAFDAAPEAMDTMMAGMLSGVMAQRVRTIKSQLMAGEIEQLKRTFAVLDTDGNGFLDPQEVDSAVRSLLSHGLISEDNVDDVVRAIFDAADKYKQGRISLGDFMRAFEETPALMNITREAADAMQAHARLVQTVPKDEYEALRVAFTALDKNGDGFLSRDELFSAISNLVKNSLGADSASKINAVVDLIMATASSRRDGRISLNDFVENFVSHQDIMNASIAAAAANSMPPQQQQWQQPPPAPIGAAPAGTAQPRDGMLVPTPPVQQQNDNSNNASVSPTSSSARRSGRRPGASTRELVVEASPIVNDVSGVPISDNQLHLEFEQLDKDNSGRLSKGEFKQYFLKLENYGLPMTDSQFEQQWSRLCGAAESTLTFERFALFMLRRSRM